MGSATTPSFSKVAITFSKLFTEKAKCRNPLASGLDWRKGGDRKEKSSMIYYPFKAKSNL